MHSSQAHATVWPPESSTDEWELEAPDLKASCRDSTIEFRSRAAQTVNRATLRVYLLLVLGVPAIMAVLLPLLLVPGRRGLSLVPMGYKFLWSLFAGNWEWVLLTVVLVAIILARNIRFLPRLMVLELTNNRLRVDGPDWLKLQSTDTVSIKRLVGAPVTYEVRIHQSTGDEAPSTKYVFAHWNRLSAEHVAHAVEWGLNRLHGTGIIVE